MSLASQFLKDAGKPTSLALDPPHDLLGGRIAGCIAQPLVRHEDHRGHLTELLTTRDGLDEPIVHVYQVMAAPRCVRAWVYHLRQSDRLCFTEGRFRIVLCDIREGSSTQNVLCQIQAGEHQPVRLRIAAGVAHGVQNLGDAPACFLNLPTSVYEHADPDKYRIPADSPLIDFDWETD